MVLDPRAIIPAALEHLSRVGGARAKAADDDTERIARLAEQITTALAVVLALAVVSGIAVLLGTG